MRFWLAEFRGKEVDWNPELWEPYSIEVKADGIRSALVKLGDGAPYLRGKDIRRGRRRERRLDISRYPEFLPLALAPGSFVLDAEAVSDSFLYVNNFRNRLTDGLRISINAEINPCRLFLFALPYWNGDLRALPYSEGRKRLEEFYHGAMDFLRDKMPWRPEDIFILAPPLSTAQNPEEVSKFKSGIENDLQATINGQPIKSDGFVLKPETPYGIGWRKAKPYYTADLRMVRWYENPSQEFGEGQRGFVLSDETGRQVNLTMDYYRRAFRDGVIAHSYAARRGAFLPVRIKYLRDREITGRTGNPYRLPVFAGFPIGGELIFPGSL